MWGERRERMGGQREQWERLHSGGGDDRAGAGARKNGRFHAFSTGSGPDRHALFMVSGGGVCYVTLVHCVAAGDRPRAAVFGRTPKGWYR